MMFNFFRRSQDIDDLERENRAIRRGKKQVEKDLDASNTQYIALMEKYNALLEEKSEGFDKYLLYHDQCADLQEKIRDYKKEVADLKSVVRKYEEVLEKVPAKYKNLLSSFSKKTSTS